MFDTSIIQKLKRTNISVDANKTKERMELTWKSASNADKRTVENLAGVKRQTLYRIYNTGAISAKLACAAAQTLGVNPYYLTGETDENDGCTDAVLIDFLRTKGYDDLLLEAAGKPRRKYQRRSSVSLDDLAILDADESISLVQSVGRAVDLSDGNPTTLLSDEDLVVLLRAMIIRARTDEGIAHRLSAIRATLLS